MSDISDDGNCAVNDQTAATSMHSMQAVAKIKTTLHQITLST
jgi:hypothetical protein